MYKDTAVNKNFRNFNRLLHCNVEDGTVLEKELRREISLNIISVIVVRDECF